MNFLGSLFKKHPPAAPATKSAAKASSKTPAVRLVFMGTPHFAAMILEGLLGAHYNVVGVFTKPDVKLSGQGEAKPSPVKELAIRNGLPLAQPAKLDKTALDTLKNWKPDIIVVAAYGKILPKAFLSLPTYGCVNVHGSLLPKWRGASPIQNSLLNGEKETGITIMLMDEGMDTGPILSQSKAPIAMHDTQESLSRSLSALGRDLLLDTLPKWVAHTLEPKPQDNTRATLCQMIEREDGRIVWTEDAESIYNRYRALYPWPGVFTFWKKKDEWQRLKLLSLTFQKEAPAHPSPIGQVITLDGKVGIQTGSGIIFPEMVQLQGKKAVAIHDFINGEQTFVGSLLQ